MFIVKPKPNVLICGQVHDLENNFELLNKITNPNYYVYWFILNY